MPAYVTDNIEIHVHAVMYPEVVMKMIFWRVLNFRHNLLYISLVPVMGFDNGSMKCMQLCCQTCMPTARAATVDFAMLGPLLLSL